MTLARYVFVLAALSACGSPSPAPPAPRAEPKGAAGTPPAAATLTGGWEVTDGVDAPESVYVDPISGAIFVSIIGGQPDARDGNGRIMKLDGDGKVISAAWATGLNAPKGLRSFGTTLWTADIDEVAGIDMTTGMVTTRIKIDGAKFLNDVACGPDGTVYVSDTVASKIYAVKDGKSIVFAEGEDLEYPNGLLVVGNRLVVGGWGKPEADFSTKVPGRLFALDLATKQKTSITPQPSANFDGVETDGRDGYIVTDWRKGQLLRVDQNGDVLLLRQFKPGAADHAFVAARQIAIVPHMQENKVAAYDLSEALK